MKLADIKLNPNNPRFIKDNKFKKLVQSVKDFPKMMELRPIVVDKDMTILGGNMRYKVLEELGYTDLPKDWVKIADKLTEAEKKRFIIEDNMPFGEWDWDKLANNFEVGELLEWGFSENELKIETEVVEDEVPEVSDEPAISKLGEVYQLGRHRLMCGDSTKIEDVEKLMDGKKADMVFTDPPYGIGKDIENDDLDDDEFEQWNRDWVSILPVSDNASYVAYHSTRTFPSLLTASTQAGWKFEKMFFFYRPDKMPVHTWNGWMMTSQAIMLFSKGEPQYLKISPAHQDVFTITSLGLGNDKTSHPTQKPVKHTVDMLSHFDADKVYDCFGGSGSTLIACEQTNRTCYMMEIDPKYCDVIRKRYAKFIGKEEEWQKIR